ncbi:protein of unknown function [Rhodovastum atsumiense]|nr:protein of unknown function [Rhodovastum atsumiense]
MLTFILRLLLRLYVSPQKPLKKLIGNLSTWMSKQHHKRQHSTCERLATLQFETGGVPLPNNLAKFEPTRRTRQSQSWL